MTIYEEMLYSQGACNAVGLLKSAGRIADQVIQDCDTGKWKGDRNGHPFIRLLVEQLLHLSRITDWGEAYLWCIDRDREEKAQANVA